jgi:hypothetical protein
MEGHPLSSILHNFYVLDFEYLDQFFYALIPMSLTVIFHGIGMDMVRRCFKRFGRPLIDSRNRIARTSVMIGIMGIMLASHFIGIAIWAAFYLGAGVLPDAHKAMYFSVESYTTLGASNFELPGRWLGFGGLEAMTGVLMFGWSTAILAAIAVKYYSLDD